MTNSFKSIVEPSAWSAAHEVLSGLGQPGMPPVKYLPNPGNAGDGLIAAGTWQLFDRLGLSPQVVRTRAIQRDDAVLFGGGGNFVPEYQDCRKFLERCLAVGVRTAVVLPHTIRGHEDLLSRLDQRFVLMCRDQPSLDHVRRAAPMARSMFVPDLALGVDVAKLMRGPADYELYLRLALSVRSPRQPYRYYAWRRGTGALRKSTRGTLKVLRVDAEKTDLPGDAASDLSLLYGSSFLSRFECDQISREFLGVIMCASKIETNRLHVGIGGALLGKEVRLYDNSYGKIRAVYEASLSHLSNVTFVDKTI